MKKIILVGFGGHAKSVADSIERRNEYEIVGYTDLEKHASNYDYLGDDQRLEDIYKSGIHYAAIGVGYLGKGHVREQIYQKLEQIGYNLPVVIDPSAIVANGVEVGEGSFIGKNVVLNSNVSIGKCCIVNTGAIVEHETVIGDFTHIAVSAVLCGQVKVGRGTLIGANATIIQNQSIGQYEIIPAGIVKR